MAALPPDSRDNRNNILASYCDNHHIDPHQQPETAMARARTIKPHFLRSRSMRAVSPLARLTFIQLWLVADDAGRLGAFPRQLAHRLYPGDKEAIDLLPGWLDELERQHCVERYTVDRLEYLRIVNWRRHQKISHATPSRLPARPEGFSKESGAIREAFGRECEKPSGDKALSPAAQNPECFEKPREALGRNLQSPCAPRLSPTFPNDSRKNEGFIWRAAAVARRAFARKTVTPSAAAACPTASSAPSPAPAAARHSR
jgi:hypothetical protein